MAHRGLGHGLITGARPCPPSASRASATFRSLVIHSGLGCFLSKATSTSFLPGNCSGSARRRSCSWTVSTWLKIPAPRSRNCFSHSLTELGWIPSCLET